MTQDRPRPASGERAQSIPGAARPSAEHVRALAAAEALGIRLLKKFGQRPLMSVWLGEDSTTGQRALLTVVDACGTPSERARVIRAAHALVPLTGVDGLQHVHRVLDDVDAFTCDFLGAGSAADLVVLRWSIARRLAFVCQVCEALVALHDAGVVHGCLCPDNILLNDDLCPVLSEVGMVSIAESLDGDVENFFGYGAYAAGQARHGAPTTESDIYSVGRLISFVTLDKAPGDEADFAEIDARNPDVAPVVRRCSSATQRYTSMAELLAALQICRQRVAPTEGDVVNRPAAPRPAPTASRVAEKAESRKAWAVSAPAAKTGAPPWVAIVSAITVVMLCVVGKAVLVASAVLLLALKLTVAVAAVGVTAAFRVTTVARIGLSLAALGVALVADPIGRLSRFDSADTVARGDAARAFVQTGGKDLRKKRFQKADFSGQDLEDAELGGADLTAASFAGAKLNNAHVDGTSFMLANMAGADLTGVALDRAYGVESASCNTLTILPPGWFCTAGLKLKRGVAPPL
jgi:hypothetical protein